MDLVLDPALDDQGRRLDTEREGLGEPDPLVLAKSPAVVLPAILQRIPGPRERAQAQDRDPVLTRVKDWVRRGTVPERLELDFGEASLKAYVKILPVLKLNPVPPEPDEDDLDILVKTDIQGTIQSERYCVPEELIVPLITDLHLQLTHYGTETVAMTMQTSCVVSQHLGQNQTSPATLPRVCTEAQQPGGCTDRRMLLP